MVNTLGLKKADVLAALGDYAGIRWEPVRPYKFAWKPIPYCYCAMIGQAVIIVDLRADDGFDESSYDCALGAGSAQRVIDALRAEKGGGGCEKAE